VANVGTIEAEIRAGTSKLKMDAAKAKGVFTGISKSVKGSVTQINAEFQTMSRAAIKSFAVIGAGSIVMTKNFSDFEQQMSRVNTIIDVSRKSLDRFSAGVLEVSNKYGRAARNEAEALYDVTSAGVAAAKAIGVLDLSTKASIAGFTRVDLSVKAGISTMNAYGLEVKDLNKIYDLQFSTVKKGILTYEQLGNSLGMLLPSSSKLGVSLEETFGGLAFLTQQGQSAEAASTALARSFDGLVDKSANLKDIGVDVFNAKGQFAGLETIITQLSRKMQGLTDEEKNATLEMIGFDIRATRAIIPMINNFGKFKEVVGDVGNSAGAMEKAFSAATDNINFEFKKLMTNISNVAKSQFLKIAGSIKGPIKSITEELQKINFDKVFNSQAMTKIKNVATGILGLGISIVGIGAAIAILANPITWLVGGAGIVYKAWKDNIGGLKDVFNGLYNWINKAYIGIVKLINKMKDYQLQETTGASERTINVAENFIRKGKSGGAVTETYFNEQIGASGLAQEEMERLRKWMKAYVNGGQIAGENLVRMSEELKTSSERNIKNIKGNREKLSNSISKADDLDLGDDIKKGTKAAVDGLKKGIKFAIPPFTAAVFW
jgi:TP901 family phage tail tape measure protein